MHFFDLLTFALYISIMIGIGVFFYTRNRNSTSYIIGDSKVPTWVISLSIFATFISSISYLALPASSYQGNWNSFVFGLSIPIAAVIAVWYFVPLYRKVNSPSAFTFLENRFGKWARVYASSMYLLTQIIRTGTILYLMALVPNMMFGWNIPIVIICTSLIVMIYSLMGGIRAVVWTDAIQAIILIAGAVTTIFIISIKSPNGISGIIKDGLSDNKFDLGSFSLTLSEPTFWVVLIYGIFINLQNFGADQNYVQRYMTSKSIDSAKRSAFWGAMIYIPVSFIFLLIGTALFSFYQNGSIKNELPAELLDVAQADKIFPYFIVHEMPQGITGLLLASIFAAGMSTISTSYNSSATILLTDYFNKSKENINQESKKMIVLYASTIIISILGLITGLFMIYSKNVLDTWWKLASIFSGGVLGLFLLGAFTKLSNKASIISVIAGLVVIIVISLDSFTESYNLGIHPYLTIVIGTSTIFITGILLTSFLKYRTNS